MDIDKCYSPPLRNHERIKTLTEIFAPANSAIAIFCRKGKGESNLYISNISDR